MTNMKINILPNLIFVSMVVVVPLCFMLVAAVGVESDILTVLASL